MLFRWNSIKSLCHGRRQVALPEKPEGQQKVKCRFLMNKLRTIRTVSKTINVKTMYAFRNPWKGFLNYWKNVFQGQIMQFANVTSDVLHVL